MAAGYHEVVYDDGDQYKGEWNANGKVNLIATSCCLTHDFSPPTEGRLWRVDLCGWLTIQWQLH